MRGARVRYPSTYATRTRLMSHNLIAFANLGPKHIRTYPCPGSWIYMRKHDQTNTHNVPPGYA